MNELCYKVSDICGHKCEQNNERKYKKHRGTNIVYLVPS